ncbi:extracellular solute-binding protein [Jiella sp. MQZ9-1]|nr:extracellular solute-binding protein [Jiella flava]MCD2469756.1 extracellular solute-binding protein [Jiella flava]
MLGLSTGVHAASLTVWDDHDSQSRAAVMTELNGNFTKAHPDVKLDRTVRDFTDLNMTLKLAVSSGDGPDVTKVNQGAGAMGLMVKQHLLEPIDAFIKQYGWAESQSDGLLERDRWSDKGEFGVGPTYGISSLGEIVGVYYNQKVLEEAGVKLPIKSFADFMAAADKVKAAGKTPFMIGTSKGHLALHMLAGISQAHIDASNRKALDDLVYGHGGTFKTPGNLQATKIVQNWAQNGYFFDGYQGISGDDAVQLFVAGQGAFLISGTWYFGEMEANPDIHFMAIPAPKGVTHPLSVGGVDLAWAITSIAKKAHKTKLAAEYINYMVSKDAAVTWAKAGYLPATSVPATADIKVPPLLKEGIAIWTALNKNNALGHYPDWSSPTMLKTFDDNTPLLLAGQETPEQLIGKLDADYQAYMKSK